MMLKINDDLSLSKAKSYKKLFVASLSLNVILLFTSMIDLSTEVVSVVKDTITIEKTVEDMKLTDSSITEELTKQGVILAAVACLQSKIESNHGKSNVGIQAKNLFGITFHKCKYVTGRYGVYSKYNSYRNCIKCYSHIQARYLKNIDGKYASDPGYVEKLKSFK